MKIVSDWFRSGLLSGIDVSEKRLLTPFSGSNSRGEGGIVPQDMVARSLYNQK